jgi:TolB protein
MNSSNRLTDDGGMKFFPQFIGGDEIIYTLFDGTTLMRSIRLCIGTRVYEPLRKDANRSELDTVMSADGRYLAFIKLRGGLSLGLQILDLKENTAVEIPPEPGFFGLRSPAIAPDNSRVAYAFPAGGRQKIYSVDLRGHDRQILTDGPGIDNWPDYSPDGKRLVFSSSRDGCFNIYTMNVEGSNVHRLTGGLSRNIRPRFSPDGRHIAFTGFRDGRCRIYVMNADGSKTRAVETNSEGDDYPNWHPEGKRLVIVSEYGGHRDLCLINVPL